MSDLYTLKERPGFFGRRRDEKIATYDKAYGKGNWDLAWVLLRAPTNAATLSGTCYPKFQYVPFKEACIQFYEESYYRFLKERSPLVHVIVAYEECYDNAPSNVRSGLDYTVQEAFSTHIQDIALRHALRRLGERFTGENGKLLQIRGPESDGWRLGLNPGQIPFFAPELIMQPSLAPRWAAAGSVEDFWQSNKWLIVKESVLRGVSL